MLQSHAHTISILSGKNETFRPEKEKQEAGVPRATPASFVSNILRT